MAEAKRILLDLPYAIPFIAADHIRVVSLRWGVQYGMWTHKMVQGHVVPRLADLQGLRERALWQLLLYDKVLMPVPTLQEIRTVTGGLSRPLSPELEKLGTLDFVEMLEGPPVDLSESPISGNLVRELRPIIVADLNRDGVRVTPLECELAECMVGSGEYEQLKESEGSLYDEFLPGRKQILVARRGSSWEELKSTIQREALGPASLTGISAEKLEDKVHMLAREAIRRRVGPDRVKEANKAEILNLYSKMMKIEDSADRLRRIFITAGASEADMKLDLAPVTDASYAVASRGQGEAIHQVVSVFLDVTEFPLVDTVGDAVRCRGEPYIAHMRQAIFEWADAVAVGDLREEVDLRREIQARMNEAGRRIRRSKACRVSLGAIKWGAGGVGAGAAAAGLITVGIISGAASFAAGLGEAFAGWWERRQIQRHRWLLHGRET